MHGVGTGAHAGVLISMRTRSAAAREESLRALYDGHAAVLLAYALRLTDGDRNRAEDIVQETLLRAWRNLDRLAVGADHDDLLRALAAVSGCSHGSILPRSRNGPSGGGG